MIDVRRTGPTTFTVSIRDGGSVTRHDVTLLQTDHQKLGEGIRTPEACIEAAFRFLLDREPKETILRRFDLMAIGRYFPEFARELPRYFPKA